MRTLKQMAVGLGLLAFVASPAFAQGRGGFGMGGGNLLGNQSVQKELKMDDAQKEKATQLAADMREKAQGLRDLSQEEQQKARAELMASTNKAVAEILKPEQLKRYNEIRYQQMGAAAFGDPVVAAKLKLTDEQKDKIKTVNSDSQSQMREIFQEFQNDREGAQKKMTALRKETNDKAVAVLTSEQKTTWKELQGAPFEFVPNPRPNN
jgi:hypothetical protein